MSGFTDQDAYFYFSSQQKLLLVTVVLTVDVQLVLLFGLGFYRTAQTLLLLESVNITVEERLVLLSMTLVFIVLRSTHYRW